MERLVVKFEVGDGYTYSAQCTLPVVFSSKEEFIILFEEKLKENYFLWKKAHGEWVENSHKIQKLLRNNKHKEAESLMLKASELILKESDCKSFSLGGQGFYIDTFMELKEEGDPFFVIPQVLTLGEWYAEIN